MKSTVAGVDRIEQMLGTAGKRREKRDVAAVHAIRLDGVATGMVTRGSAEDVVVDEEGQVSTRLAHEGVVRK